MRRERLKGKLVEKKRTYAQCAKLLGISTTTFNCKVNGKTKFYIEEANMLSEDLGLTNEEKIDIFFD